MELDLGNLHHAYLVVGSADLAEKALHELFESEGEPLVGSPDFFLHKAEMFGVDDARDLSASAQRKAFTGRKVYFIAPNKITLEAQNALLKTFEEPIASTHFFLVVREVEVVIPTLRSRMQVVEVGLGENTSQAEKFIKLSIKDRLNFVKKFVDTEKSLPAFLDELLLVLRKKPASFHVLKSVHKMRILSDARAASPRLILEHLSLSL